jgi:TonB family protein
VTRLLALGAALLLAGCAGLSYEPVRNATTLTATYPSAPEPVLQALEEAARALPEVASVSSTPSGFVAREPSGGNDGVLTVVARSRGGGTEVGLTYAYVPRDWDAWTHLPLLVVGEAAGRGLAGAVLAQARAPAPADDCPAAETWPLPPPRFAADAEGDSSGYDRLPKLVGGLEGLQRRVPYPDAARRAGIAGQVIARFTTDAEGRVRCAEVVSGLPGGLTEGVLEVIADARFVPGVVDGEPVGEAFTLPISFWLR